MPNSQNDNRSRVKRVPDNIISKDKIPDNASSWRKFHIATHFRKATQILDTGNQLSSNSRCRHWVFLCNERSQPY